ncbi:hypothetical protein C2845_PM07G40230 [Panicum miliaceum]|uniref:Uncharacterized protein n=1 Tax=Panicum miliaceum TaxID=4540 RepID=A0A3L6SR16_PANMI|nr:hypothetical protein C2845_PM07G40230 [Panicum miliaceum]
MLVGAGAGEIVVAGWRSVQDRVKTFHTDCGVAQDRAIAAEDAPRPRGASGRLRKAAEAAGGISGERKRR